VLGVADSMGASTTLHLGAILEDVVGPVLRGMTAPEEVDTVELGWSSHEPGELVLSIRLKGELFRWFVTHPGQGYEELTDMRSRLAFELQDFIAESAFAWGQLRTMDWDPPNHR
jgi:hypothetical protein